MRYELARDSDARAGGLRDSAIRTRSLRCLAVTVALLVCSLLCPINAYADQWSSVWHHSSFSGGEQYIVGAYNKFDAAAYICGYSNDDVQSWDLTVRYKLSTQQTAFLTLADSLENVTPWQDDTLSSTLRNYFGDALWALMTSIHFDTDAGLGVNPFGLSIFQISYWSNNKPLDMSVWAVNTTSTDVDAAKAAIQQILNGGGSGGGSAGGDVVFSGPSNFYNGSFYGINSNYNVFTPTGDCYSKAIQSMGLTISNTYINAFPLTASITVPDEQMQYLYERCPSDEWKYAAFYSVNNRSGSSTTNRLSVKVMAYKDADTTITTGTIDIPNGGTQSIYTYIYSSNVNSYQISFGADGVFDGTNFDLTNISTVSVSNSSRSLTAGEQQPRYALYVDATSGGGGGDEPTGPGDWPDDPSPEPPDSPTVPTPTPPEQPTPYTPITPPTIPPEITTNVTDPTSSTDYTPWLQKILQQLRNLNDALTEHCVHIQQQIVNQATNIINALNVANEDMKDYLYELQRGLTGYLKQLFDWLADQFDFESNPYNDNSVLYWLRQIYDRLGKLIRTNVPTVLEPDPTEPFDFWAWLWGLITNVIGGFIGDFVDGVDGLIDGIKDKFPFSIPWDIAAMLALLSANRVTPVFDITIPAVNGWWDSYHYRVDLQPYNAVASVCRSMFLILWAFVLLMKTNWMLDLMGSATGLGERFASRVGRGTE